MIGGGGSRDHMLTSHWSSPSQKCNRRDYRCENACGRGACGENANCQAINNRAQVSYLHIYLSEYLNINTPLYLHIYLSEYLNINTPLYLHTYTCVSAPVPPTSSATRTRAATRSARGTQTAQATR